MSRLVPKNGRASCFAMVNATDSIKPCLQSVLVHQLARGHALARPARLDATDAYTRQVGERNPCDRIIIFNQVRTTIRRAHLLSPPFTKHETWYFASVCLSSSWDDGPLVWGLFCCGELGLLRVLSE